MSKVARNDLFFIYVLGRIRNGHEMCACLTNMSLIVTFVWKGLFLIKSKSI